MHTNDLHHEATSRLFEKRLNRVEVAIIAGHEDTRMLMRYTHLRAKDVVGGIGVITTSFPLENQLFETITKVSQALCS